MVKILSGRCQIPGGYHSRIASLYVHYIVHVYKYACGTVVCTVAGQHDRHWLLTYKQNAAQFNTSSAVPRNLLVEKDTATAFLPYFSISRVQACVYCMKHHVDQAKAPQIQRQLAFINHALYPCSLFPLSI